MYNSCCKLQASQCSFLVPDIFKTLTTPKFYENKTIKLYFGGLQFLDILVFELSEALLFRNLLQCCEITGTVGRVAQALEVLEKLASLGGSIFHLEYM